MKYYFNIISPRRKIQLGIIVGVMFVLVLGIFLNRSDLSITADVFINTGTIQVANLTQNSPQIGLYEKFELTFNLNRLDEPNGQVLHNLTQEIDAGTLNPYWPYDPNPAANIEAHPNAIPAGVGISVDGLFLPSGETTWDNAVVQPGFWYQDYDRQIINNKDWLYPKGNPVWKIRFAPTKLNGWQYNDWRYKIRITDASGQTFSNENSFTTIASSNHGFVRASDKDSRYFSLSDGTFKYFFGLNDYTLYPKDMDTKFADFGQNGINLLRPWWQGSQGPVVFGISGQGGVPDWGYRLGTSNIAYGAEAKPGELFSIKAGYTNSWNNPPKLDVDVKTGTKYRLSASVRTVGITGTGSYGVYLAPSSSTTNAKSEYLTGDNDWRQISVDFTTTSSSHTITAGLYCANNTAGTIYFTDLSLKEDSGNGQFGPEIMSHPNLNVQNYVSQRNAWEADYMAEAAKKNNIYLKIVTEEKQDMIFLRIQADGLAGGSSENNVYGSATHATRVYQQYYWRYVIARYGSQTSIHSFELFNEGDPYNGNQYNLANAFGTFFGQNDPNRHLTTTSFWHSVPMDFWKTSSLSYIDMHEYIGPAAYSWDSHGPRFYAWYDSAGGDVNSTLLPISDTAHDALLDTNNCHRGSQCFKIVAHDSGEWAWGPGEYHVGINPNHTYTLRYWAKGENINNAGGSLAWERPQVEVVWSRSYHENDYIGGLGVGAPLGTYDWQLRQNTNITVPSNANTANISIRSPRGVSGLGDGTFWTDDVEFIDNTTGQNLFVDGGFEGDRIDYDTALLIQKYGVLLNSYGSRINKPVMWAETGIRGPNIYGTPYKGYVYTGESQELVDDTDGIHIKKMVWAHLLPLNPNMVYWWKDNILKKGLGKYFKAFQTFIADVPLANGHYVDAKATTSNANLRAWGQKDLTNNKAHLWIDNIPYTWKNVVGGNIPPPVSGTVTLGGLASGSYRVEWWNTTDGSIIKTEDKVTQGSLVLNITDLVSDIAVKVYPLLNTPAPIVTSTPIPPVCPTIKAKSAKNYYKRCIALQGKVTKYGKHYIYLKDRTGTIKVQLKNSVKKPKLRNNRTTLKVKATVKRIRYRSRGKIKYRYYLYIPNANDISVIKR